MKKLQEGKAEFYASVGKISRELEVFYNPIMKFNRDVSILILNSDWAKKNAGENLRIALPLAGSGIRGVRILLETKHKDVFMNDINPDSVKTINKNLELNNVKAEVSNEDANVFMDKGFGYIDIDPFGSPNPFLDTAIKKIKRYGILAVTATDTGCLAGSYPDACRRKYWAQPLKTQHMHETGLRILIRKIQLIGMQYDKALIPVFSYFKDHYFRIFFTCHKGKKPCDKVAMYHRYYLYCPKCGSFKMSNYPSGECCVHMHHAGPLWAGMLSGAPLAKEIAVDPFLSIIKEESELGVPYFYDIHKICKIHKIGHLPKRETIMEGLRKKGYKASQTHFTPTGIKTDAELKDILSLLRA